MSGEQLRAALSCLLPPAIFFILMDRADLPLLVALEFLALLIAWILNPGYRTQVVILAVVIPCFFVAGEVYFRLRYFGPAGLSFDRYRPAGYGHPSSLFEYDDSTYTGLKPNTTLIFRGAEFRVNGEGFRGPDCPAAKPTGVYRIVALGASATMGTGIRDQDIVFSILERRLNERIADARVEIVNLSIGGSLFGHMIHCLEHVGRTYAPDRVLFLANETLIPSRLMSAEPRKVSRSASTRWQRILRQRYDLFENRFFFAGPIKSARDRLAGVSPWKNTPRFQSPAWQTRNLRTTLDELERLQGAAGTTFYLLKPILKLRDRDDRLAYRTQLRALAEARGMSVIDTYGADFDDWEERDLVIYPGDNHPNAVAQRLYAEAMLPELERQVREDLRNRASGSDPGTRAESPDRAQSDPPGSR